MEDSAQQNEDKKTLIQPVPTKKFNKKILIYSTPLILLVLGLLSAIYFSSNQKTIPSNELTTRIEATVTVVPSPFAFQEITIPYLRSLTFESKLGELELVSTNGNYESYLTSYDSDGLKVNAQLTKPMEDMPVEGWPAIIFVHGYIPPQNYQTLVNYSSYVDYLARNGFVVFKIDLRGHGDSEGEPGGSYYSSDYIIDVLNARSALSTSDFVNPASIGIWGHSMAGNVTFRALAVSQEIPAAVIWAGAVYSYEDWQKYGIQDGSYQPPSNDSERQRKRRELFAKYGEFDQNSEFWKQVAGTNYLSDIKAAIQLNHAIDDNVVNIGYSRDLATLLDQAGVIYELKEYNSGGHNLSGSAFNAAMQNAVEFFKKHL
jgi:dipeptidyl aminopeptidase/acylaminoacyl peptidase